MKLDLNKKIDLETRLRERNLELPQVPSEAFDDLVTNLYASDDESDHSLASELDSAIIFDELGDPSETAKALAGRYSELRKVQRKLFWSIRH